MIRLEPILKLLTELEVEFVVIGGVAITAHGSAYLTLDLNFCYSRANENLKKLVTVLSEFSPRLRGFPEDLPFIFDISTLRNGTNFLLPRKLAILICLAKLQVSEIMRTFSATLKSKNYSDFRSEFCQLAD